MVSCLEGARHAYTSHLAVIDIRRSPPQLLYHVAIEPIPEGIEFTPDGKQLFVGCTGAHHIVVYDVVEGVKLVRSPYVIRTGHGHASLAISVRYGD